MKRLDVKISGKTGSGKTALLNLLGELLEKSGLKCFLRLSEEELHEKSILSQEPPLDLAELLKDIEINIHTEQMLNCGYFDLENELERLSSKGYWPNVINDDNGNWAIAHEGSANNRAFDSDFAVVFSIAATVFKPTIREAWDHYIQKLRSSGEDV